MRVSSSWLVAIACLAVAGCEWRDAPEDTDPQATRLAQASAFWLPINSERLGASGRVADADVCIGLVWDFSNLGMARAPHCDDFVDQFPYAIVRAATGGTCGDVWDYGPDATVVAASGCIDPDFEGSTHHVVDVTATIDSPLFTGAVRLVTP